MEGDDQARRRVRARGDPRVGAGQRLQDAPAPLDDRIACRIDADAPVEPRGRASRVRFAENRAASTSAPFSRWSSATIAVEASSSSTGTPTQPASATLLQTSIATLRESFVRISIYPLPANPRPALIHVNAPIRGRAIPSCNEDPNLGGTCHQAAFAMRSTFWLTSARVIAGFRLSPIEVGIRMIAPRSFVIS
jgi:hypothetical protein